MTTIQIPIPDSMDLNGDGKVTLSEIIRASLWIAFWVVLGMNAVSVALMVAIYILVPWSNWDGVLKFGAIVFCASICIGFCYAAYIGLKRSTLPEWQKEEACKDIEMERKRKEHEFDQIRGFQTEREPTWDGATQDRTAHQFLTMSHDKGTFITRGEWTKKGLSESDWNRINKLMQKYGIRDGSSGKLVCANFATAWAAWIEKTTNTNSWVRSGGDFVPN